MSDFNDGGTAFPIVVAGDLIATGMTLRDYFAAKAMQGMLAADTEDSVIPIGKKAIDSYAIADAMLRARERQK